MQHKTKWTITYTSGATRLVADEQTARTDRGAAAIFRVFQVGKATIIETRDDHARVIAGSGHDGSAEYEHKVDVKGRARHFRRKPDGMWGRVYLNKDTGRWNKSTSVGLRIGERDTYCDPSF